MSTLKSTRIIPPDQLGRLHNPSRLQTLKTPSFIGFSDIFLLACYNYFAEIHWECGGIGRRAGLKIQEDYIPRWTGLEKKLVPFFVFNCTKMQLNPTKYPSRNANRKTDRRSAGIRA